MTAPTLVEYIVCGCVLDADHVPGCVLGGAETIAAEAAEHAVSTGRHQLLAVVAALVEAGCLRDVPTGNDPDRILLGILDNLWESGLIDAPTRINRPQLTVVGKLRNLSPQVAQLAAPPPSNRPLSTVTRLRECSG
jgi:hypothetical protein